ncbi:MAG: transposase [Proteobacteria bacterium]|nr:transposase [Pseudomonadota bacterium]MBU1650519.1 transposase [Pseudomonadota bacterium]
MFQPQLEEAKEKVIYGWAKKNNKSFFGYKNHASVDLKHKIIRHFHVTSAEVHGSNVFVALLDSGNICRKMWGAFGFPVAGENRSNA